MTGCPLSKLGVATGPAHDLEDYPGRDVPAPRHSPALRALPDTSRTSTSEIELLESLDSCEVERGLRMRQWTRQRAEVAIHCPPPLCNLRCLSGRTVDLRDRDSGPMEGWEPNSWRGEEGGSNWQQSSLLQTSETNEPTVCDARRNAGSRRLRDQGPLALGEPKRESSPAAIFQPASRNRAVIGAHVQKRCVEVTVARMALTPVDAVFVGSRVDAGGAGPERSVAPRSHAGPVESSLYLEVESIGADLGVSIVDPDSSVIGPQGRAGRDPGSPLIGKGAPLSDQEELAIVQSLFVIQRRW